MGTSLDNQMGRKNCEKAREDEERTGQKHKEEERKVWREMSQDLIGQTRKGPRQSVFKMSGRKGKKGAGR